VVNGVQDVVDPVILKKYNRINRESENGNKE
jgi:hypothetical protein